MKLLCTRRIYYQWLCFVLISIKSEFFVSSGISKNQQFHQLRESKTIVLKLLYGSVDV